MPEPIKLITTVDGEPFLSTPAMSLLLGVDEELISAQYRKQGADDGDIFILPEPWLKQGRRRAKEAASWTGSNDVLSVLQYWARKQGCDVIVAEDTD